MKMAHLEPPCWSNLWAKDQPSRSITQVLGLPGLTPQQDMVDIGNVLLEASVTICMAMWYDGCWFPMESPKLGWLWFPAMVSLWKLPGMIGTIFRQRAFGTPWAKPLLMLHSSPALRRLGFEYTDKYEDAQQPTNVILGTCWWQRQTVFKTFLVQAYPPDLGKQYGSLARDSFILASCAEVPADCR